MCAGDAAVPQRPEGRKRGPGSSAGSSGGAGGSGGSSGGSGAAAGGGSQPADRHRDSSDKPQTSKPKPETVWMLRLGSGFPWPRQAAAAHPKKLSVPEKQGSRR